MNVGELVYGCGVTLRHAIAPRQGSVSTRRRPRNLKPRPWDRPLPAIEIVVPKTGARLWQKLVVERLRAAGHGVAVAHGLANEWPVAMRAAVEWERRLFRR